MQSCGVAVFGERQKWKPYWAIVWFSLYIKGIHITYLILCLLQEREEREERDRGKGRRRGEGESLHTSTWGEAKVETLLGCCLV